MNECYYIYNSNEETKDKKLHHLLEVIWCPGAAILT